MDHRVVELRRPPLFCSNRPRCCVYIDSVYRPPSRVCTWMVNGSNIGLAFVPFVCLGPALSVSISTRGRFEEFALRESKSAITFVRGKNQRIVQRIRFVYLSFLFRNSTPIAWLYFIELVAADIYISNNEEMLGKFYWCTRIVSIPRICLSFFYTKIIRFVIYLEQIPIMKIKRGAFN